MQLYQNADIPRSDVPLVIEPSATEALLHYNADILPPANQTGGMYPYYTRMQM